VDGTPTYDASGSSETTLDVENALSSAPGAQLMVYEGADSTSTVGLDMFTKIVDDGLANVVSFSWGLDENSWDPSQITAMDNLLAAGAAKGITFLAASGDNGSSETLFPATDPYVTAVGGTTLNLNTLSGQISSETAWSGSGGGISSLFPQPAWQTSTISSNGMRMIPDVSLDANPNTGYKIYYNGSWYIDGGTSAATPEWAAIIALVDQSRANNGLNPIGLANSALYPLAGQSVFHDITSGSNGYYNASAGYDMVTGLGSVDAWQLINALANLTIGVPAGVTGLTLSSPGPTELDLAWNGVSGAVSYKIYRSPSSTGTYTLIGTSTSASYSDQNLTAGTTYYYKVSAVNSYGEGTQSNPVSGSTIIKVTGIALNQTTATLAVGASETLTAAISPANAANQAVTWSSSDPTIASVDSSGYVQGLKSGTAIITATTADGGLTASCTVLVGFTMFPAQQNAPLDKEWRITFNQPINASTIPGNILLYRTDATTQQNVSAAIIPMADSTDSEVIIVQHTDPFAAGASYVLIVGTGIKALSGSSLSAPVGLIFQTQS